MVNMFAQVTAGKYNLSMDLTDMEISILSMALSQHAFNAPNPTVRDIATKLHIQLLQSLAPLAGDNTGGRVKVECTLCGTIESVDPDILYYISIENPPFNNGVYKMGYCQACVKKLEAHDKAVVAEEKTQPQEPVVSSIPQDSEMPVIPDVLLECPSCGFLSNSREVMSYHIKNQCKQGGIPPVSSDKLVTEMQEGVASKPPMLECPYCEYRTDDIYAFDRHNAEVHGSTTAPLISKCTCNHCTALRNKKAKKV